MKKLRHCHPMYNRDGRYPPTPACVIQRGWHGCFVH